KVSSNKVCPTAKAQEKHARVREMLIFDRQRIPRATPEPAEMIKPMPSTAMMMASVEMVAGPAADAISTPSPISTAEAPKVAAVPKSGAISARMSINLPKGPSVSLEPNSGLKIEEIKVTRPRRYEEYAMAAPTSAYAAHGDMPQ